MLVKMQKGCCIVTKEKGDMRLTDSNWSTKESVLLYRIKQNLNARGFDLIKKRMWKDGHLVDDCQQYLRSRKPKSKNCIAIYNHRYAIEDAGDTFNKEGSVSLAVVHPQV